MAKSGHSPFFGHLSLQFPDGLGAGPYPLSMKEASHLRRRILSRACASQWFFVETMNNRMVGFDYSKIQRIRIIDDGADWPNDMFKSEAAMPDYSGIAPELYELMAEWVDGCGDFERRGSAAMKRATLALIEKGGFLGDQEGLDALLRHTVLHFSDGSRTSYEVNRGNLPDLLELEEAASPTIVEISEGEGDFEGFYPLSMLRVIDIPMIELKAAQVELES